MRLLLLSISVMLSSASFGQYITYDLVITNVNLIDVNTNKTINAVNVYINNGIAEIATKKLKILPPTKLIDGTGKYLMPGLYDMHVHFPEYDAERFFQLQTAAGITNCRIMKSTEAALTFLGRQVLPRVDYKDTLKITNDFKKRNGYTHLRKDMAAEERRAHIPSMKIAYNFFGNETFSLDTIPLLIASVKAKGYDFIKIFAVKNEAFFDAVMEAAKTNDLMVCGHALGNINPKKVLASGYKSIEHVGYFDKAKTPEALDSLIDLAKKYNVFICPTLDWSMMVYHSVPADSLQYRAGYAIGKKFYKTAWDTSYSNIRKQLQGKEKQYADYMRNGVANKIEILKKMRAKGLRIVAGSDAEEPYQTPGFSLIDELKLIQKAGYSNAELLQMITTHAAMLYNSTPHTIYFRETIVHPDPNKANYILLSKNPLENIENLETVEFVIKGSTLIDSKKLMESIK